jgi:lipid II:glycine glycyltransferase (peptidoglycan interpeptide bridge formation enzyme)
VPFTRIESKQEWSQHLAGLPCSHLLQGFEWGELKARHGWAPVRLAWREPERPRAAASVLRRSFRRLPAALLYAPRGPLLDWSDAALRAEVLDDLEGLARSQRAIFVRIDPEVVGATGVPGASDEWVNPLAADIAAALVRRGWRPASEQVQFRNTVHLDLTRSEDGLLAAMKPKTRYNIRLAARKGVNVRPGAGADFQSLYRMYAETSLRDGFAIRPYAYYADAWDAYVQAGLGQPLVAEVEGQAVAGAVILRHAGTATYLYGMSRELHREKMPNHLLQWEAIRWARAQGCHTYDFWGAPDSFQPGDPLWGVWRFKEGFGGTVIRTLGAWDYPASPGAYAVYTRLLPGLLALMRLRGRRQTRATLAESG